MPPEIVLPSGVVDPRPSAEAGVYNRGMVVNETDLPDAMVIEAVKDYVTERASVLGVSYQSSFQTYANNTGSFLARSRFRTPNNVFEEIALARDLAERDDDVGAVMGTMIATAFEGGMQNTHEDEVTVALFNRVAKHARLDRVFPEMYRELLIASSVTTVSAFTRETFQFQPEGADRQRSRSLRAPLIGVLPAEQVCILDNDIFGTAPLYYRPATATQEKWLREFFNADTTAARRAEMRAQDPVLTTMLVEERKLDPQALEFSPLSWTDEPDPPLGGFVYRLNPNMVHRSSFPKGAWRYPRPLLTRNFPLLEAKRLLNLMDYALLQGGSNYLVIAKKGSDKLPAKQEEIDALLENISRGSRAGLIVGDHRLDVEIVTPDLSALLSPEKRRLVGRKLAMGVLRLPESGIEDPGQAGMEAEVEFASRVISHDRRILRRHVEEGPYEETVDRNAAQFQQGAANIWQPKIVLQGTQYFTDYILKARDRGDIPRRYAAEAAGFDWDAAVQQRRREVEQGVDEIMAPAAVPFDSPNKGPQDNNAGRPPGSSSNNGRNQPSGPPAAARGQRVIQRNAGETVRAMYEDEIGSYRIGELTYAVLEQFDDSRRDDARITAFETHCLEEMAAANDWQHPMAEGPITVVPVNPDYEIANVRVVALAPGLRMLVGERVGPVPDRALVARAFVFREPEFAVLDGEEKVLQWGFPARPLLTEGEPEPES